LFAIELAHLRMKKIAASANRAEMHLLSHCGALQPRERFLLIVDNSTKALADRFLAAARRLGALADHVVVPLADRHGAEPPPFLAPLMHQFDLVAGLTFKSLAHTFARLAFTEAGGRSGW
jgi:hypothetical protein